MYFPRALESQIRDKLDNSKILFVLGARQVGKTTLIERLCGEQSGRLLNMDIEAEREHVGSAAKLDPHDAMRSLNADTILAIDEAHHVPDIGRIAKAWYDKHVTTKIVLLGSSSAALLHNAASELVGRNEKTWLTPLLFREVLAEQEWFDESRPKEMQHHFSNQVRALLRDRLIFGSYPEAVLSDNPQAYLTNLSRDYLLKDIFNDSSVRSPEDVRRLLQELAAEIGEPISLRQLATRLDLSRQTVQHYLDLLEGIFVIFSLSAYATDPAKEVNRTRKYYFWDTGVRNAMLGEWLVSERRSDIDALWENWVLAEIFKQSKTYNRFEDLYFWQSRNGSTVDLLVKQGSELHPFDARFDPNEANPSKAFENRYGITPKTIHPGNVLEVAL